LSINQKAFGCDDSRPSSVLHSVDNPTALRQPALCDRVVTPQRLSYCLMRRILAVLLLAVPLYAHNGAVAIAVPVEGIVVDGDLSDWPEGMARRKPPSGARLKFAKKSQPRLPDPIFNPHKKDANGLAAMPYLPTSRRLENNGCRAFRHPRWAKGHRLRFERTVFAASPGVLFERTVFFASPGVLSEPLAGSMRCQLQAPIGSGCASSFRAGCELTRVL